MTVSTYDFKKNNLETVSMTVIKEDIVREVIRKINLDQSKA